MSPDSLSILFQEYAAAKSRVTLNQGAAGRPLSAPFFVTNAEAKSPPAVGETNLTILTRY